MDSSIIFFTFGVLMFILVIGLLIFEYKDKKIFALITPAIISIILFGAIFIKDSPPASINEIEIGLSVLGIAVSVWVGLNIYNVIEKNEIEKLIKDNEQYKNEVKISQGSLIAELTRKVNSIKKYTENELDGIKKSNKKFEDALTMFFRSEYGIGIKNSDGLEKNDLIEGIRDAVNSYGYTNNIIIDFIERNSKNYILELDIRSTANLNDKIHLYNLKQQIQSHFFVFHNKEVDVVIITKLDKIEIIT